MNPEAHTAGIVLRCDTEGAIKQVLHDDLGVSGEILPGRQFAAFVDRASFTKALDFLVELRSRHAAFSWAMNMPVKGRMALLQFSGITLEGDLLIVAASTEDNPSTLSDEILRMNNEQTKTVHGAFKIQASLPQAQAKLNSTLYDEISRMNNELINLQRELEKKNVELGIAYSDLDAFARSVSHDLRAPLMHMRGFADALLEDYSRSLDATGQEYLHWIVGGAQEMDTLINDILAYSHASRADLILEVVPLDAVLSDVQEQLKAMLVQCGAQVQVAKNLPYVRAQRALLTQIVANLLSNAVKFVSPEVIPQVQIWTDLTPGSKPIVRLWIEDNGIGIPPEDHQRIFQLFERLHGIDEFPGTGIGLAIVKKGVERMGGRVGLESVVGKGSRFWIELPEA